MASSIIINELFSTVQVNLKAKTAALDKAITDYMNRNMQDLTAVGPMKMILFTESDKDVVFDCIGVDKKVINKTTKSVKITWGTNVSKPINIALVLAIRYYKMNKNTKMANKCLMYLVMAMYPTLFYNFWKYQPNEDIMRYTMNNLTNKYKIKQLGNLYLALSDTAMVSDKTYEDKLLRGTDEDIRYYIQALNTRIRSFLRKIANEFYKNEREKNYMSDEYDDPNPDSYKEVNSTAYSVDVITNAVASKLMNGPDMKIVDMSAKTCQVSRNELRNYLNRMIISSNMDDIKLIISSILYLYLYDAKNNTTEIRTNKFLLYCLEMYKKSNTSDENIIRIKKILDKWLEELGAYKKTQRLATINNFRRAIFTFFVFTIMANA